MVRHCRETRTKTDLYFICIFLKIFTTDVLNKNNMRVKQQMSAISLAA
jgi:hypothetical protein